MLTRPFSWQIIDFSPFDLPVQLYRGPCSYYSMAYWYGAVTLVELMGHKQFMSSFFELVQTKPFFLLNPAIGIGLPAIPILLIAGRMIRWEERVVRFLHTHVFRVPGNDRTEENDGGFNLAQHPAIWDPVSFMRMFSGALALPTIAMFCGKWFLSGFSMSPFQRTLLGGLGFVAVKGFFKIYLNHNQVMRKSKRIIIGRSIWEDYLKTRFPPRTPVDPRC